jgi:hypothetical protein
MNKEQTKELINLAKSLATTEELKSLINDLEGFVNLQSEESPSLNSEETKKKWLDAREKLWSSFEKITAQYGITPELIRQQLENPTLFSPEQTETLQTLKQGTSEKAMKKSPEKLMKARG